MEQMLIAAWRAIRSMTIANRHQSGPMMLPASRTKIVATLGPVSRSPEVIRRLIGAGMDVARLNFSHGTHDEHAAAIRHVRQISVELDSPVTIIQDLQGPKVRIGALPAGALTLDDGQSIALVPEADFHGEPAALPIDYPHLAADAPIGATVMLADGLIELRIDSIDGAAVRCIVESGGEIRSRQGVVLPHVPLRLPSLTEKDRQDLDFGLAHGVDWIALSFVRSAADVQSLKDLLRARGATTPVIAKIEKPEAVDDLEAILNVADAVMVARGDLGVEMRPEKVPLTQKHIIRACNRRGLPVVTATQMLESMITEPRPTRAEASDVANAILDGTDAVMLSGESAVGRYPVESVRMMHRIAAEVEPAARFSAQDTAGTDVTHALSLAIGAVDKALELRCIVAFTTQGYSARLVSARRPRAPILALTPHPFVYHALNLLWGVRPIIVSERASALHEVVAITEHVLRERRLAEPGDRVLIVAGLPMGRSGGTNVLKLHVIGADART